LLLAAGGTEFNTASFGGPDINRIARVAGYAPQTFDRHLAEKTEILIRVHERSQDDERAKIASTMQASPSGASHRERAGFRRSKDCAALLRTRKWMTSGSPRETGPR
jgi:AcrR family transcriptional regulator